MGLVWLGLAIVGTAIWSAWDFGGGFYRTKSIAAGMIVGLVPVGLLLCVSQRRSQSTLHPIVWIAGAIWFLGLGQSVPMDSDIVQWFSPGSYAAYRVWVPPQLDAVEGLAQPDDANDLEPRICVSVAPTYTQMAIAGPAMFGLAFWLSSLCFTAPRAAIGCLLATALAGACFSFFGLADAIRLARDSDPELRARLAISPVGADDPFGPFVNNNNGAGYLNLALGSALGLFAYRLHGPSGKGKTLRQSGKTGKKSHSPRAGSTALFVQWPAVACMVLIGLLVAGILGSFSRGGFLGLLAGSVCLVILVSRRRRATRVVGGLMVLLLSGLFAWFMLNSLGLSENVGSRIQTLYDGRASQDPRLAHWRDAWAAAQNYFPAGAGIGAYRYAYLPYQQFSDGRWFVNADGMPMEWLVEGGVWLLPLVLTGLALIIRDLRRVVGFLSERNAIAAPLPQAMIVVTVFTLPALLVTQCFDFGILQPSLLLTTAMIFGGLGGLATTLGEKREPTQPRDATLSATEGNCPPDSPLNLRAKRSLPMFQAGAGVVVILLMTAGLAKATIALHDGAQIQKIDLARKADQRLDILQRPRGEEAQAVLEELLGRAPDNSLAHELMARLILDRQSQLGASDLYRRGTQDSGRLANWTLPTTVRRAYYMSEKTPPLHVDNVLLPSQESSQWQNARRHAILALKSSPLDDAVRYRLIELDMVHPAANKLTPIFIEQNATLRRRYLPALQYLESLASVYPGGAGLQRVTHLRESLQQERAK